MALSARKLVTAWIFGVTVSLPFAASGDESEDSAPSPGFGSALRPIVLPGTGLVIEPGVSFVEVDSDRSQKALLQAIAVWLSSEFGLPSINETPAIAFASKGQMVGLRYRDMPLDAWGGGDGPRYPIAAESIVAIYDSEAKSIYLPEDWSGNTPGELSVLVHEMVHHIQYLAGLKFECAEAREEMAFEAQERWLRLFGRDLLTDFELDPLTLLIRTKCMHF